MGAVSCTESKDAFAFPVNELGDVFGCFVGEEVGALVGCLVYSSVDFFLAPQGCKLNLGVGVVVPARYPVEFYLAAEICLQCCAWLWVVSSLPSYHLEYIR